MQVASCGNIVDCLEFDLTRCDSADDSPPSPRQEGRSVLRRLEHARSLSDSVSTAHHNGFAVLDPPVLADDPTSSDTESAMEVEVAFDLEFAGSSSTTSSAQGCQDSIVSG